MERRLAAIVAVDVTGYSRLMGADEVGTHSAVKAHLAEVVDPRVRAHNGRTVKLMGDGALMEFPSAVEAVTFAVEVQRAMQERNEGVSVDRRIVYRIGINIGDIIIDEDDIFGDGVNIAARLEGLAEPGGICIAGNVYDQVKSKIDLGFVPLGRQTVKNIAEPVTIYRIRLDRGSAKVSKKTLAVTGARHAPYGVWAAGLVLLIAVGGAAWWQPWASKMRPSPPAVKTLLPLPDKPSIAVLPFTNMSDDKSQEYFSDGMTDDIITDLSKVSGLFVVARNSTFTYKGTSVDVRKAAAELGVRYMLEGSVRRAGPQVRISAQLIDATTGGHLWADRYDGTLDNVFSLQDEIARKIVAVLAVQLTSGEHAQLATKKPQNAAAYEVFLKGWEQYLRQTPEGLREAITHFEKAVEIDPDYARAYAALAATYWQIYKRYWHDRVALGRWDAIRFKAEEYLEKAKRQPTALSHQIAAAMLSHQGQHAEAIAEGGQAIAADPNDADSYVALAGALSLAGDPGKALQLVRQAMRLNPHFPPHYLYEFGLAEFGLGDFKEAAGTLEKATALNPEDRWSFRLLLAAYGHLGRYGDAERISDVIERNPLGIDPLSIRAITFWYRFKEQADRERLVVGLRKANVPE